MKAIKNKPKIHYFQYDNWMNDPNGLVVKDGIYHLFYQANPDSKYWGNIGWGHATSEDLITWQDRPHALNASKNQMIFSGSAISSDNLLGYQEELIAFYTACDYEVSDTEEFIVKKQSQCIAISDKSGNIWKHFEKNPVLDIDSSEFRDPKVIKLANNSWLMLVSRAREHAIDFYMSSNLVSWNLYSSFTDCNFRRGAWECPDLIPLSFDGITKHVLIISVDDGFQSGGSGVIYIIGQFENGHFIPDNAQKLSQNYVVLDKGSDFFAPQSFSYEVKSRSAIILGWLNNWQYAKLMPSKGLPMLQSVPRELGLVKSQSGALLLSQTPINSVFEYFNCSHVCKAASIEKQFSEIGKGINGCFMFTVQLNLEKSAGYELNISMERETLLKIVIDEEKNKIFIERTDNDLFENTPNLLESSFTPINDILDIVVIGDYYSFEVFINKNTEVFSIRSHRYFDNLILSHKTLQKVSRYIYQDLKTHLPVKLKY